MRLGGAGNEEVEKTDDALRKFVTGLGRVVGWIRALAFVPAALCKV